MPNWRKDKRKKRLTEGRCAFDRCPRPSTLTYYDLGLCEVHFDYYFDEDLHDDILKKVLGLPVSAERYEAAAAARRKFERDRSKTKKQAQEEVESEEFEDGLFKSLNRRERASKRKMDNGDSGWVPDLEGD
jgi:hypothetical protein